MSENESNLLAIIVILVIFVIGLICCAGAEINEKQQQINELTNKVHQQIELIDALQQSR